MTWKVVSTVHGGGKRRDVVSGGIPFLPSIAATNGAQDFLKLSVMFCPEAVSPPTGGSPAGQIAPIPANGGRAAPSSARPSPPGCPAPPQPWPCCRERRSRRAGRTFEEQRFAGQAVVAEVGPNMRKADDAARRLSLLVASPPFPKFESYQAASSSL
jgi:hypothetical protein